MPSKEDNSVLIIAAEDSSALYAQRLLELWKDTNKSVAAFGVGSQSMEKLGFERLGKSEEMAVVGFQEVIAHYKDIKKVFDKVIEVAKERKPKFALLLDYPGFNLKLAGELKKLNIPVVYYISPQVWAWKKSRIHKIKKVVDKMLVLFPFEEAFYKEHGVSVDFVGHPLLDELRDKLFSESYHHEHRSRYGIAKDEIVLGLMPGSRNSEIRHHLVTQMEVARKIYTAHRNVKVALLIAPSLDIDSIRQQIPEYDFPLMVVKDDPPEMIHLCDVILCASGTATILVGLLKKPMVIMYKMNPLTAFLAKLIVRSTPYFGMVNLVMGKLVAPEFFQEQASPQKLFSEISRLVESEVSRKKMQDELAELQAKLGHKGATQRVSDSLQEFFC